VIERILQPASFFRLQRKTHWLWLAMLLVHLPGLIAGWKDVLVDGFADLRLSGFVALNLSALIFILKIRDVRWLEFGTDRRSLLTLSIAVALLHINLVRPPDRLNYLPQESEAVAGVLFVASLLHVQQLVQRLLAPSGRRQERLRGWILTTVCDITAAPLRLRALAPRAPPAV
jgi:hypothetical protein